MPRILGISGSLRRGSYNTALLNAAVALVDAGTEVLQRPTAISQKTADWPVFDDAPHRIAPAELRQRGNHHDNRLPSDVGQQEYGCRTSGYGYAVWHFQ